MHCDRFLHLLLLTLLAVALSCGSPTSTAGDLAWVDTHADQLEEAIGVLDQLSLALSAAGVPPEDPERERNMRLRRTAGELRDELVEIRDSQDPDEWRRRIDALAPQLLELDRAIRDHAAEVDRAHGTTLVPELMHHAALKRYELTFRGGGGVIYVLVYRTTDGSENAMKRGVAASLKLAPAQYTIEGYDEDGALVDDRVIQLQRDEVIDFGAPQTSEEEAR